ncbi:glycosyltransferase [bacterium]|nr:glycosyltransferase [bacterium]
MKLSVITITYKDAPGLALTLQSLKPLQSSGISWEHVVVDGSPEENASTLSALEKDWPLKTVHSAPRGVYAAMNEGLEAATGNVVWFLNGGDQLRSAETLGKILSRFTSDPSIEIICSGVDLVRDGKYLYSKSPKSDFLKNLLGTNKICHQGIIYRSDLFKKVGTYNTQYKFAADYEHLFRCYFANVKAVCVPDRLAIYDMGGLTGGGLAQLPELQKVRGWANSQMSSGLAFQNEILGRLETLRLVTVKKVAGSFMGNVLRPIWLAWNRR